MVASLGTPGRDTEAFRKELAANHETITVAQKSIMQDIKALGANINRAPRGDQQVFQEQQRRFTDEYNRYIDLTKKISAKSANAENRRADTYSGGMQGDAQEQIQEGGMDIQFLQFREEEVTQRHQGILQLERDAGELLDMFKDMQTLVNQQQVGLDIIEGHVANAKQNVEAGHEELVKAEELQQASRKKQCCIVGFLVLAAAIIVVVFYFVLR